MSHLDFSTPNFTFIDWLRGVAALLVVYFHFDLHVVHRYPDSPVPPGSFTDYFIFGHFDLGKFAVGVFFLISGFLIPATLAGPGATLRRYAIHRFFRLYPAYWLSLLVFIAVEWVFGRSASIDWSNVAVNLTMLQKFFWVPDVVGVYWTLQIELIFYGVCALLFITDRLQQREMVVATALLAGLVCALIRYQTGILLPVALFIAVALMFVGDSLRALVERRTSATRVSVLVAVVAVGLIPIALLAYRHEGIRYLLTYWAAMGAFIGVFAFRAQIERSVRTNRIGRWLADCSYSVYLLHGSVGGAFGSTVYLATDSAAWAAFAMFGSTYLLAYAAYRYVERPCMRFGRSIADR